jgi:hypothetical protein
MFETKKKRFIHLHKCEDVVSPSVTQQEDDNMFFCLSLFFVKFFLQKKKETPCVCFLFILLR